MAARKLAAKKSKSKVKSAPAKTSKAKKVTKAPVVLLKKSSKPTKALKTSKKKVEAAKPLDRTREVQLLITDNYESGKRLAWSFLNRWRVRIEEDEVLSITGAALCEAAHRFKKELGVNFKTFLFYYLRGMLLKEITKRVQEQKFRAPLIMNLHEANDDVKGISLENLYASNVELTAELRTPEELLSEKERVKICREATSGLDELEKTVLERYFADDESVVDIAKSLGYCRCHISRVKSKALETLSDRLQVLAPSSDPDQDLEPASPIIGKIRRGYKGVRGRRKGMLEEAA